MPRKQDWPPPLKQVGPKFRVWWLGRWHYLGTDKDKAEREHRRLVALWATDPHAADLKRDELLVPELCVSFLASADAPAKGKPQRDRYKAAALLLGEVHAYTPVDKFGPAELRAWSRWLATLKSEDGSLRYNRTSIRHYLGCVRRIWKWGVEARGVSAERWQSLRAVGPPKPGEAREPKKVLPADPASVAAVLPHLPPVPRAVVQLLRTTAARPTEILTMRPADLDTSGDIWWHRPPRHKNTHRGKTRAIPLDKAAQAVLTPWLDGCDPGDYVFTPAKNAAALERERDARRKPPRFPSEETRRLKRKAKAKGRKLAARYDHRSLLHAVARACRKAKVKPWSTYSLRHMRGAEVRASHGLEAARALLGHSALSMTDHYASGVDRELAERVARDAG